jgi:uncharacterized membrane protein YgcG
MRMIRLREPLRTIRLREPLRTIRLREPLRTIRLREPLRMIRRREPLRMIRPPLTVLALAGLLTALGGCESTQERSARLEAAAKREKAAHPEQVQHGLSIAHVSTRAHVVSATAVHDSEGAAAAVTVTNTSSRALTSVPIAIAVRDAGGRVVYQNNTPGLESALTAIPSIPAHGTITWVDDQVSTTSGSPAGVSATVGEATPSPGSGGSGGAAGRGSGSGGAGGGGGSGGAAEPRIEVRGTRMTEASTGEVSGAVHNASTVVQRRLIVYVLARRGATIVAAGRAELPELVAGASLPFHAFLIGSPAGARLEASAPPSTFG